MGKHVLVLGARAPAALEWVRGLARLGWTVSAADSLSLPLTRFSRYCRSYTRLPEPRRQPHAWLAALLQQVERDPVDWIIPTCEEVFYLAWAAPVLVRHCRLLTSPLALLQQLHHKGEFAALARQWSCAAPETRLIDSPESLARCVGDCRHLVFKPAYSRFAHRTLIAPDASLLAQIRPDPDQPWVAQRRIHGQEFCSYSLVREGRVLAHALYQPRYRVGQGSGIYFEVAQSAAIDACVARFAQISGYHGQLAFDWICDDDGRTWVLECNPRATSGIHLFDDQPDALAAALADHPTAQTWRPTPAPRMVTLAMGLFGGRHWGQPRYWRDLWYGRDVIHRAGDCGPLMAQLPGLAELAGRALRRRCGLLAATTADIEWDGQPLGAPSVLAP